MLCCPLLAAAGKAAPAGRSWSVAPQVESGGARTRPSSLRNWPWTFSVQHGVQLVGQVIEHVANVVQDGPG